MEEDIKTVETAINGILDLYNKEKEKNKELNNLIYQKLKLNIIENGMSQNDYISKDKIREKIEWIERNILENDYASDEDCDIAEYQVQALQELLEERN